MPGPHKDIIEGVRPVKIKPEYTSSINELPGYYKNPEIEPNPPNPYIKFTRNTATTMEKQIYWGPQREKTGPKQEIIPIAIPNDTSDYGKIGKESNVIFI